MNQPERLERDLTVWLAETAAPQVPPYFDDILRRTASLRQRPRWSFIERLLPMTATASFRAISSPAPWRAVGILGLILLALVVGVVLIGSRQERLPAPFGLAKPGLVAYSSAGDIFVVDPVTNRERSIVAGPETDRDPQWSRDGTRIVFGRDERGSTQLFTVRPDGSELTAITPEPEWITSDGDGPDYAFSPDGSQVLFVSGTRIRLAQSDGSGVATVSARSVSPLEIAFRPPGGSELGMIGSDGGVYLIDVAGGPVRTLVPADAGRARGSLTWAPDGSLLGYNAWDGAAPVFTVRGHILEIASGEDRLADPLGGDVFWDYLFAWSNDGQRLVLVRGYVDGFADVTAAVIPASGTGSRVETEHGLALNPNCCGAVEWAPDDQSILWMAMDPPRTRLPHVLVDPNTGAVSAAPWHATSDPAWQRLAR